MSQWVSVPNLAGLLTGFLETDFLIATVNAPMTIGEIQLGLGTAPGGTDAITIKISSAENGAGGVSTTITGTDTEATTSAAHALNTGDKIYLYISAISGTPMDLYGTIRLDISGAEAGVTPAYTTLTRVKWVLGIPGSYTTDDTRLNELIVGVSSAFDEYMGESFVSTDRTEYQGGGINESLILNYYPLASDLSNMAVTEDTTSLTRNTDYIVEGYGLYRIADATTTIARTWAYGTRNIKIVYKSGRDFIPDDIQMAATEEVARSYNLANTDGGIGGRLGLASKSPEAGGSWSFTPDGWSPNTLAIVKRYRRWR